MEVLDHTQHNHQIGHGPRDGGPRRGGGQARPAAV